MLVLKTKIKCLLLFDKKTAQKPEVSKEYKDCLYVILDDQRR